MLLNSYFCFPFVIKSLYSGILYEKGYVHLLNQIHTCYEHPLGPRKLPEKRVGDRVYGVVVPYSSYVVSGPCAAWSYKLLAEHYFPETYVLLVPDTSGTFVNYVTVTDDFETPFGICYIDRAFAQALLDTGIVSRARDVQEFALEVQLPFLQHACRDKVKQLQILPLIVPHTHNVDRVAQELVKIKKDIVVIVASHLSLQNSSSLSEEELSAQDLAIVQYILDFDVEGLEHFVRKNKGTLPGIYALILGLHILKQLGVQQGELLHHYRSSLLISGQGSEGFASMVF